MKKPVEIMRVVIVSPELVLALALVILHWLYHVPFEIVREVALDSKATGEVALLTSPLIGMAVTYRLATALLRPEGHSSLIVAWPEYWRLKLRVWVSLGFAGAGLLLWYVGWAFMVRTPQGHGELLLSMGGLLYLTVIASLGIARIEQRDALDGL